MRGFPGLERNVPAGYRTIRSTIQLNGGASNDEFRRIHDMVRATSPNYYNVTWLVYLTSTLVIE